MEKNEWLSCPACGVQVLHKNLAKHLRKMHPYQAGALIANNQGRNPGARPQTDLKRNQASPAPVTQRETGSWGHKSHRGKPKSGGWRITTASPSTGEIRKAASLIDNMVGNWRDQDTSRHGGVSLTGAGQTVPSLAEQMARSLKDPYLNCPHCGRKIKSDHMAAHIRVNHEKKEKKRKPKNAVFKRKKQARNGPVSQAKHMEDHEADGSRHLGHFRREASGQFGSYPLHDDYSEESFPD